MKTEKTNGLIHRTATIGLVLLLIPLCFIRLNNFHDWGDDFAQYLLQSGRLVNPGYTIPVFHVNSYSPETKGLLFSALLIPATLFSPNTILIGKLFVSIGLIACSIILFQLVAGRHGIFVAFGLALLFAFNYHVLRLKDNILPDFYFTALLLLSVWFFEKGGTVKLMPAILCAAFSAGFRSAGLIAVAALTVSILFMNHHSDISLKKKLAFIFIMVAVSGVVIITESFFSNQNASTLWYFSTILNQISLDTLSTNCRLYWDALRIFFEQELPMWMNHFLRTIILLGIGGGIIIGIIKKNVLVPLLTVLYLFMLLIYPYHQDPVRLLIPAIPLMLILMVDFYRWTGSRFSPRIRSLLVGSLVFTIAVAEIPATRMEIRKKYVYPPYESGSRELMHFISNATEQNDTVAFAKPWALAWFTDCNSVPLAAKSHATFIVMMKKADGEPAEILKPEFTPVWNNSDYVVYKAGRSRF